MLETQTVKLNQNIHKILDISNGKIENWQKTDGQISYLTLIDSTLPTILLEMLSYH